MIYNDSSCFNIQANFTATDNGTTPYTGPYQKFCTFVGGDYLETGFRDVDMRMYATSTYLNFYTYVNVPDRGYYMSTDLYFYTPPVKCSISKFNWIPPTGGSCTPFYYTWLVLSFGEKEGPLEGHSILPNKTKNGALDMKYFS